MHIPDESRKRILHRLKISKGHLDTVIKMVEEDEYCINVLHQSQAVQSALKNTDELILACHLECCVAEQIKTGDFKKAVSEVLAVYKKGR